MPKISESETLCGLVSDRDGAVHGELSVPVVSSMLIEDSGRLAAREVLARCRAPFRLAGGDVAPRDCPPPPPVRI